MACPWSWNILTKNKMPRLQGTSVRNTCVTCICLFGVEEGRWRRIVPTSVCQCRIKLFHLRVLKIFRSLKFVKMNYVNIGQHKVAFTIIDVIYMKISQNQTLLAPEPLLLAINLSHSLGWVVVSLPLEQLAIGCQFKRKKCLRPLSETSAKCLATKCLFKISPYLNNIRIVFDNNNDIILETFIYALFLSKTGPRSILILQRKLPYEPAKLGFPLLATRGALLLDPLDAHMKNYFTI